MIEQSLLVAGASLAVAVAAMTITALVARRLGRVNVVDVTWGLALVGVAAVCAALSPTWEAWLALGLVAVWGLRLSWHILVRSRGEGEDPRYVEVLDGGGFGVAIRKVFVVQGAAVWLVSLPLQAAAVTDLTVGLAGRPRRRGLGRRAWCSRSSATGSSRRTAPGPATSGLRCSTPGCGAGPGTRTTSATPASGGGSGSSAAVSAGWLPALLTVVAPVTMTYFLRNVTGAALLEETMSQRPGWDEYAARVPLFFPRPPRR